MRPRSEVKGGRSPFISTLDEAVGPTLYGEAVPSHGDGFCLLLCDRRKFRRGQGGPFQRPALVAPAGAKHSRKKISPPCH